MTHASPVSFLRVSLAAGIGVATMVTAAACGSNSTLPPNSFGSSSGGGGSLLDATASSSGGSGSSGSGNNYNSGSSSGSDNSSSGSTNSSSGGGTMCVAQCHADSDCQSSCPTPASGTNCCDQSSSTCFASPNAQCTPQQVGSE